MSDILIQKGSQLRLGHCPDLGCFNLAVLEQHQGWNTTDSVFGGRRRVVIDIQLGNPQLVSVFIRHNMVQLITPDEMRGRVGAAVGVFVGASNELGEFEGTVVDIDLRYTTIQDEDRKILIPNSTLFKKEAQYLCCT